ncbi:MAG TPA: CocE/NonD family hydrolase, partial [Phenylobacterium sp.]
MILRPLLAAAAALALLVVPAQGQPQTPPMKPDIAADFKWPNETYNYVKREVMIPMRDGVKLYTVLIIPKGAKDAPILLTRTPYNAKKSAARNLSPYAIATGS